MLKHTKMSADEFQTKYSTVVESIFKSAVSETTKLFETMVDDLKEEISRIRKENEDLKARCSEFESVRSNVNDCPGERDLFNDASETRDTAVQCDLVASHTLLVEQSQPLSSSPLQNREHHIYDDGVVSALREHDYVTRGNFEMECTLVKQEQEEDESTVVSGHDLSVEAGPVISTICSYSEIPLSQRHEEDQMAPEPPFLGRCDGLQGQENQSSEPQLSLVISLPEVKEDMDEGSEISSPKVSEIGTQYELMTPEKRPFLIAPHKAEVEASNKEQLSVVLPQCEGQTSVNEQTHVTLQLYGYVQSIRDQLARPAPPDKGLAYDVSSNRFPEAERSSQPEVVRRRRGRPPKRAKRLKRPAKEILQPLSSEVPTEKEVDSTQVCPDQTKKSSAMKLSMNMTQVTAQAPPSIVPSAVETINTAPAASPQATSALTTECSTSVTLQDAMLLLEAMNQSGVENASSSLQRTASPHKTQSGPRVGPLENEDNVLAQTAQHPSKTHENENNFPRMEPSATTQMSKEKLDAPRQTTYVTPASEVRAHSKTVIPKQQNTCTLATATTSAVTLSTQRSFQSPQRHLPHPILIIPVAPRKQGSTLPVPRSVSLSISAQTPTQQPAVVSTGSTAADVPVRTPSPVAEKTIMGKKVKKKKVASSKLPPIVTPSTAESTDLTSRTLQHPVVKTTSPRLEPTDASRQKQSPTILLKSQPNSTKSLAPSLVPSRQLSNISGGAADSLGSPPKNVSVSGIHAHTETCSSLNVSVWPVQAIPPNFVQKLSCAVRLARIPFPMSTEDSFFVPRLPTNVSWDSRFILKEGAIREESTSENISIQPDICPGSKETSVAMSVHTPVMPEEPNDIQEMSSLSSENVATLEEFPDNDLVQPSTPYSVSQPGFEKSAMAVNETDPSAVSGAAVEPTANVDKEIINIRVHDCSFPKDGPIEEKEPATLLHSSSITSKDTSDPHSQLSKSQFLAKLFMSPVAKDPEKPPSNESIDARAPCAGSSASEKKRLRKTSLMDRLENHIKTQLQARRMARNTVLHTEPRPKLGSDQPNHEKPTSEHIPFSTVTSDNSNTLIVPMESTCAKDDVTLKRTASEPSSSIAEDDSHRMPKDKRESSPANPSRGSVGSKRKKSSLRSPRSSSSAVESFTRKKTPKMTVHTRRTRSDRHDTSPENGKAGGSPNNTETRSGRKKRTNLSQDDISPKASDSSKICSSPKTSANVICRRLTFSKDSSCAVQIKRKTNSKNTRRQTDCSSIGRPKLANGGSCSKKTREFTSVKKSRLIQDAISPKKNSRGMNNEKLAKTKTLAKMRKSNRANSEPGKKRITAAVWFPPKEVPAAEKKPAQKETPRSPDLPVDPPLRGPRTPIPFRAPPVISPLQPLAVIGGRLLRNQCGECGRILSSTIALESHVSLHKDMSPFSCSLCGKSFTDSKALKRHDRVHRNGRIHVCKHCGKGFVYTFSLTKHIQMVHNGYKPFACPICNKGCFTKKDAELHARVHTGERPFHCNLCEKKFSRRTDLNLHLRGHNGEKKHWCPYCGKGFLHFNNLKSHKYTHTGEKPYSCPHCPKCFSQSGHLSKHVKNVHRNL